ncbi:hypothetical protein MKW98_002958, partial [Papaver atlanticum]
SFDGNTGAQTTQSQKGKEVLNVSLSGSGNMDDRSEMNKRGKRLRGCFSNYVKEIIAPCLNSRFQLPNVADSTTVGPLYQSSMSFKSVFIACRGIRRHGMQTAMYFLPHLVLNAVCHSTAEARIGITGEILSVPSAGAAENSEATDNGVMGGKQSSKSTGQNKDPPSEGPNVLLIQFNNVSELLAAIPKVTLTKASFPCKAYARALLCYESHVLERSGSFNPAAQRNGMFEDEDVSILMEIYSGSDEPDGLWIGAFKEISNACFDMDVAKILQAMSKKYQFSVAEKIALSKQALLAPLAAVVVTAAAGLDSYTRPYPFVVKLHMLSELEDFHRLLVNDPFLEKSFLLDDRRFKKVIQDWENRMHRSWRSTFPVLCYFLVDFLGSSVVASLTTPSLKEDVIGLYTEVRELQPRWVKGYFYMAKYYDELLVEVNIEPRNLYQALPRLLTLWFDFGSKYYRESLSSNKEIKLVRLGVMRGCLKDLRRYQWLAVLPQLASRICHQNEETVQIIKDIITSVLQDYSQQALWTMTAVSKSHVPARREAAARIIQEAHKYIFVQFASLIDHLIRLRFHPGQPKARTIYVSTEFSSLKRMMPVGIIMPIQPALTVSLPMYENEMNTDPHNIDMFSASDLSINPWIHFFGLSGTFIGSDGVERPFLCKPKDDLKRDARMMEFVSVINHLLAKYPESRQRKLCIRTFTLIPLTEDCGITEWVPHTRGLRHILEDIHTADGKFDRQKTNPLI